MVLTVSAVASPQIPGVVTVAYTPRVVCFEADYSVPTAGSAQVNAGGPLVYSGAIHAFPGQMLGYNSQQQTA